MRPVSLTYTGTVGVSIQDVFDLISDPSRMAEWLPNCVSVVPGPSSKGKGDRHRLHFERNGRKADAVIEVIEFEPPTTYAWVEIIYRRGSKTFFKLEFQGGTTKITMKCVWVPASWRAWLLGQFYRRRSAHKMFDGLLQNLRKALTRLLQTRWSGDPGGAAPRGEGWGCRGAAPERVPARRVSLQMVLRLSCRPWQHLSP
jgi:uncharacterized protein YndB with AHSA1/START domain